MNYYAAVREDGGFHFSDIKRAKKNVHVSARDAMHGVRVARLEASVLEEAPVDATWETDRVGCIIRNPDGTFWNDTLSSSKLETEQWWGADPAKPAQMATIGFQTVGLRFSVAAR